MEELAKLEEERGNPAYMSDSKGSGGVITLRFYICKCLSFRKL